MNNETKISKLNGQFKNLKQVEENIDQQLFNISEKGQKEKMREQMRERLKSITGQIHSLGGKVFQFPLKLRSFLFQISNSGWDNRYTCFNAEFNLHKKEINRLDKLSNRFSLIGYISFFIIMISIFLPLISLVIYAMIRNAMTKNQENKREIKYEQLFKDLIPIIPFGIGLITLLGALCIFMFYLSDLFKTREKKLRNKHTFFRWREKDKYLHVEKSLQQALILTSQLEKEILFYFNLLLEQKQTNIKEKDLLLKEQQRNYVPYSTCPACVHSITEIDVFCSQCGIKINGNSTKTKTNNKEVKNKFFLTQYDMSDKLKEEILLLMKEDQSIIDRENEWDEFPGSDLLSYLVGNNYKELEQLMKNYERMRKKIGLNSITIIVSLTSLLQEE